MADWQEEDWQDEDEEEDLVIYSEVTLADKPFFRWIRKFLTVILVIGFLVVCLLPIHSLWQKGQELDATIEELEKQIEEEKIKELQIRVDKEYYQSMPYKEQMARNRCRLIYPGEILITILQK